jgi:hypothetical protein
MLRASQIVDRPVARHKLTTPVATLDPRPNCPAIVCLCVDGRAWCMTPAIAFEAVGDRNKVAESRFLGGDLLCGVKKFASPTSIPWQAGKKLFYLISRRVTGVFGNYSLVVIAIHHLPPVCVC